MRKAVSIILTGLMALSMLTACGSNANTTTEAGTSKAAAGGAEGTDSTDNTDGTVYKVGIIQLTEHTALDAVNKGFVDGLNEAGIQVDIDQQNAQNDQSACDTIATKFVSDQKDLVFAIATPAAQVMAGKTTDIPIVFSAVTDPVVAELVEDYNSPGGNVTGTSDLTPVAEQIDLLHNILPDAKTVGILYCSAEDNSIVQADLAKDACTKLGLEYKEFTVSSSNEIQSVVESMVGKVDCIYAPTDNMIAESMATVSMVATENNLPIICGEEGMLNAGGLATYGINYYSLGKLAAEQAVKILKGEAVPADIPVGYLALEDCELKINEDIAAQLEIEIPESLK